MSVEEFAGKMIFNFRQVNFNVKSIKVSADIPDYLPTQPVEPEKWLTAMILLSMSLSLA